MTRVLLVGFDPTKVDYSDPALPPGMTAEKIHAGVEHALAEMSGRGWLAENCFINPDETPGRARFRARAGRLRNDLISPEADRTHWYSFAQPRTWAVSYSTCWVSEPN